MARRANLSFGSLNPFGGGDQSFSSFNVGKSTVDASQAAYLEFQKVETDYQAGLVDDATYRAAFEKYRGTLKVDSSEAVNAQARAASLAYSLDRDALIRQIQAGQASWSQLVAFDQNSMAGMNPGSQEYRDREARMWASQVNEFREAEQKIADDLSSERITYAQALEWYEGARNLYSNNYGLMSSIEDTIAKVKVEIVREQDNEVLNKWKGGTLSLDGLLAYAAKVQADEPGSARAKTWEENAAVATDDAVVKSLNYRYGLTEEYRDLELLVASAKPPQGHTSISKDIQYVYGANGWEARTVYKSKTSAPTPAEVQAYKELMVKVGVAQKRMGEIEKVMGTFPGGWVNEDDIIRKLGDQQGKMVKGTPAWLEVQEKIDYFNERKRTDEIMRKSGVVVTLPTVKSETQKASDVSPFERPITPSKGGVKLPPEPPPAARGGGGGGGGGAGTGKGLPGTGDKNQTDSTKGGFLWQVLGPANSKSKNTYGVTDIGGTVKVAYKRTGLPIGMSEQNFKTLYNGMTDAIREGETTWTNKETGIGYVLPLDPSDRLAIVTGLDKANIAQRRLEFQTNPNQTTEKAYKTATYKMATNTLHVMDDKYAGVPNIFRGQGLIAQLTGPVLDKYLAEDRQAAPIAASLDYMSQVEEEYTELGALAQVAFDKGNKEQALRYVYASRPLTAPGGLVEKAAGWASLAEAGVQGLVGKGAELPETGDLAKSRAKMLSIGGDTKGEDPTSWLGQLAVKSGLEEVSAYFAGGKAKGEDFPFALNPTTGEPIVETDGSLKMNDGWVRVLQGGKIVEKQMGSEPNQQNEMMPSDSKLQSVRLQVGDEWRTVMVGYEIGKIGQAVQSDGNRAFVYGKKIDVTYEGKRYQMAQDPINPARWLPIGTRGLQWQLPEGARVVEGSSQFGQTGSQIIFSTGAGKMTPGQPGKGGQTFIMALQSDGTYAIMQSDAQGNVISDKITADQDAFAGIIDTSGIRLDVKSMADDQKIYYRTGLPGINIGDPSAVLLLGVRTSVQQQSLMPGGVQSGGSNFLLQPLSNFTPRVKPKAAPLISIPTKAGGSTLVGTGQIPAPTNQPYAYEGAGGTNLTPWTAPSYPSLASEVAAIQARQSALTPAYNATPVLSSATGFTTVRASNPYVAPSSITGGIKGTPYIAPSSLTNTPKLTTPKITPPPVTKAPTKLSNVNPTKL